MKSNIRLFACVSLLSALLVWGCSRSAPPANDDANKNAPAAEAPSQPAPPAAPAAEPAPPAETEKPAAPVRKATPRSAPAQVAKEAPPVATPAPAPAPPPAAAAPTAPAPSPVAQAPATPPTPVPPPEPATRQVTIPSGTQIFVRTIDAISSETSHQGDVFKASIDQPVVVDGKTIIPRRADVDLKLVDVESAGKIKGQSELKVQLDKLYVEKKPYTIVSNTYSQEGASSGGKAARNVGIGAVVGGVLGGIIGGKKGAVIGAGAGGGGGAVVSKGQQIQIDPETQLVFRLENPIEVTVSNTPNNNESTQARPDRPSSRFAPPTDRPAVRRRRP